MDINQILALDREICPEKEEKLWEQYWTIPDNSTLHVQLVELYLPLVVKAANKMSYSVRQKVPLEELLSSGVIGLHYAISNYSKEKGVLFSTFAFKRIRGAILDELRSQDHLTRTQRNCYREICAAINRLTKQFSRPPTDNEIAEETNLTCREVDRYIGMGSETINLNDEFEEGLSYLDVLADEESPSPRESAHRILALERIREHFRLLSEREQKLLFLRHYEEMSVKEIAKVLEISEGRISQIYQKIIIKLRALLKK